jgi:phosphoglycerate dehydrogenase-like enzyme
MNAIYPPAAAVRRIEIVSQLGPAFDAKLAAHSTAPRVRALAPDETPWRLREPADILLARPFAGGWKTAPRDRPEGWPGSLRWVMTASTGVDFFPDWLLEAPVVTCARGVSSAPIAEYVMAAILGHAKRLDAITLRGPEQFRIAELGSVEEQTLGLAGFGAIGRAVADRARAFGMRILALRRSSWEGADDGVEAVSDIAELAARSDHLVLALPATPSTRHILDAAVFAAAKPSLHIVNVARGSLIDQQALLEALDAGRVGAATLDVTDPEPLPAGHPLYTHPHVRLTPHSSWSSTGNSARLERKLLDNLDLYASGKPLTDVVDPGRGY